MEKPASFPPSSIFTGGTPNALRYCHTAQIQNADILCLLGGLYGGMIHEGNGICKRWFIIVKEKTYSCHLRGKIWICKSSLKDVTIHSISKCLPLEKLQLKLLIWWSIQSCFVHLLTSSLFQLEQVLIDDVLPVMKDDSLLSSHPIVVDVSTPAEITSVFDGISYSKVRHPPAVTSAAKEVEA